MDTDVGQNSGEKAKTSLGLDKEVETRYGPQFEEPQTLENKTRPEYSMFLYFFWPSRLS